MMQQQKILVTGGLGFIGAHTAVALIEAGYEVVIVDDLSNAERRMLGQIRTITGVEPTFYPVDVADKKVLSQIFTIEAGISAVIHFAAFKAVGESVVKPLKYFRNNLNTLITLLECMEAHAITGLVFSSSATVYGDPDSLPLTEEHPFKPALSAYGSTKQMGEDIIQKVCKASNLKAIALRYFNPVGAHPTALLGELPLGKPNNLMPFVTQVAAGKLATLTVYGNDYPTVDGTCIRDYIHVTDLALAHVKSCDRLCKQQLQASYEVFNIGTGNGISVMQIIHAFEQYNQLKLSYVIGNRRTGDAPSIYADVSKANEVLGWKASKGLADMVTDAWKWQQQLP